MPERVRYATVKKTLIVSAGVVFTTAIVGLGGSFVVNPIREMQNIMKVNQVMDSLQTKQIEIIQYQMAIDKVVDSVQNEQRVRAIIEVTKAIERLENRHHGR